MSTDADLLATIGRALVSQRDVSKILREVCGLAARLCRADRGSLYLVDPEAAEMIPAMSQFADCRRLDDAWPEFGAGRRHAVSELRFINHVVTTKTPLAIADARESDMIEPAWIERFSLKSVLGVPVAMDGEVIGIVVLDTVDAVRPFDEAQQALAQAVADQLALFIHKRVLLERLEVAQRLRETEGLLTLAGELGGTLDRVELARRAAREVTKLLDADTTFVIRFDMQSGSATPMAGYHVPQDLRGARVSRYAVTVPEVNEVVIEAFRTGQPITCADASVDHRFDHPFMSFLPKRARGLVVIPLLARGLPYGAVVSYWWDRCHVLNAGGLRVATSVARQVSLALHNAELYAEATKAFGDLQTAQEQLVRGETLRALGELAMGTAHHLNNLLAVIVGRVQLLTDTVDDEAAQRSLGLLERAALDAAEVVRRVQEFTRARPEPLLDSPVDLRAIVADTVELTRPRWDDASRPAGTAIHVVQELAPVPPVAGDAVALREVTLNLLLNAIDAMPSGGTVAVSTRLSGSSVVLAVRDTGVGMSPEVRRRALEPFFTTKHVRATGLGLSAAYGIVTRHRGQLTIDSEEGKGTMVIVHLPATPGMVAPAPPAPVMGGGTLRILLVDDDARVRDALTMVLRRAGHVVAVAPSGRTALDHLSTGLTVDLVLTDLGMPDLSGWALARAVKERWPGVVVGLITGWGEHPDGSEAERAAVDFTLAKPVDRQRLAEAINAAMRAVAVA